MDNLDEEIKSLREESEGDEIVIVTNPVQSSTGGIKRLKDSQAAGVAMTFDD
jgi:hypothetical protein